MLCSPSGIRHRVGNAAGDRQALCLDTQRRHVSARITTRQRGRDLPPAQERHRKLIVALEYLFGRDDHTGAPVDAARRPAGADARSTRRGDIIGEGDKGTSGLGQDKTSVKMLGPHMAFLFDPSTGQMGGPGGMRQARICELANHVRASLTRRPGFAEFGSPLRFRRPVSEYRHGFYTAGAIADRRAVLARCALISLHLHQREATGPPLDLRLFAEIAPQKVRLGMKSLQIAADRDRLGEI